MYSAEFSEKNKGDLEDGEIPEYLRAQPEFYGQLAIETVPLAAQEQPKKKKKIKLDEYKKREKEPFYNAKK